MQNKGRWGKAVGFPAKLPALTTAHKIGTTTTVRIEEAKPVVVVVVIVVVVVSGTRPWPWVEGYSFIYLFVIDNSRLKKNESAA